MLAILALFNGPQTMGNGRGFWLRLRWSCWWSRSATRLVPTPTTSATSPISLIWIFGGARAVA